ncbi:MAG: hypothetical protein IKV39_05530 [Clostridia bacterium]|nr:hypothetical protein [Clostridia bacterium]
MKKILPFIVAAVMMICLTIAANAAFGVVVEAQKVDEKPNMEYIDESWGEPVATNITSASENTWVWKYWNEWADTAQYEHGGTGPNGRTSCYPEDLPMNLYLCWDSKYLYFALDAEDESISGDPLLHRGDGVQLWVQPAVTVEDPTIGVEDNGDDGDIYGYLYSEYQYIWTFDSSDWDCHAENAAVNCEYYLNPELDGRWHAMIAIPWINIGFQKSDLVDGVEVAIAFMRISSRTDYNGVYGLDEGYAGGICWGRYFKKTNVWGDPTTTSLNTIILRDPATAKPETNAPETEAPETEAPVVETEAPETEAPVVETEAPETEAPETEAPETEAPAVETEAPETEAPVEETHAPETEAPAVETEAPETEAPAVETEAPATEAPTTPAEPVAEKNNTGLIIGIVAAVVVVGAVVGIVLGKKKK